MPATFVRSRGLTAMRTVSVEPIHGEAVQGWAAHLEAASPAKRPNAPADECLSHRGERGYSNVSGFVSNPSGDARTSLRWSESTPVQRCDLSDSALCPCGGCRGRVHRLTRDAGSRRPQRSDMLDARINRPKLLEVRQALGADRSLGSPDPCRRDPMLDAQA